MRASVARGRAEVALSRRIRIGVRARGALDVADRTRRRASGEPATLLEREEMDETVLRRFARPCCCRCPWRLRSGTGSQGWLAFGALVNYGGASTDDIVQGHVDRLRAEGMSLREHRPGSRLEGTVNGTLHPTRHVLVSSVVLVSRTVVGDNLPRSRQRHRDAESSRRAPLHQSAHQLREPLPVASRPQPCGLVLVGT